MKITSYKNGSSSDVEYFIEYLENKVRLVSKSLLTYHLSIEQFCVLVRKDKNNNKKLLDQLLNDYPEYFI